MITIENEIPLPALPRLLDIEQVSDLTTLKKSMLYRMIDAGIFTRVKVYSKTCFEEKQIVEWINARIAEGRAKAQAQGLSNG